MFDPKQQAVLDAARQARIDPTALMPHQRELLKGLGQQQLDTITKPLTADERAAVERKKEALKQLIDLESEDVIAKYKIEFFAGSDRSTWKAFRGSVTIFRSGSALHGGGDEIIYPCVNPACPGFIPPELIAATAGKAGCPKCQQVWDQELLKEMFLAILPAQKWAYVLSRFYIRLNHNADLYLKSAQVDIRKSTVVEKSIDRGGTELARARMARKPVIYPLTNIYKDLSVPGVDIETRFKAFVTVGQE